MIQKPRRVNFISHDNCLRHFMQLINLFRKLVNWDMYSGNQRAQIKVTLSVHSMVYRKSNCIVNNPLSPRLPARAQIGRTRQAFGECGGPATQAHPGGDTAQHHRGTCACPQQGCSALHEVAAPRESTAAETT